LDIKSDDLYSETIPCMRCGKVGESILMLGRWFCGECISEMVDMSVKGEVNT